MMFFNSHLPKRLFSTLSELINQRVPLIDPESGEKIDHHLNRYHSPIFSAYLYKRRVGRSQIYPKIHVMDDVPNQQQPHLAYQALFPIKNAMDEATMQRLVKQDPSNISSSYIISIFSQDHFKPLIDEYVKKVLVCGKVPGNYDKMTQIEERVKELYRTFYYGEPVTPLQREIELKYLSEKQSKYIMHHSHFKDGKQNDFTRCKWREEDQRVLEDLVNWRKTDPEADDTNFRPYFQPLQLLERCPTVERFYSHLGIDNWYDRRKFNSEIKIYYQISEKYYNLIADKIYNRINKFITSVEFTNLLKIPPDFMIEMAMYQIHVWLICQRLNTINTRDSRYLSNLIMDNFKSRLELSATKLNVKKENILLRNLHNMIWKNSGALRLHFVASSITKQNPYKGIDALVWSILFFEKVNRYGDQVYLMGEYIMKNYQMIQNYSEADFFNGIVEFDAYLMDPRYKEKIQAINPPLSKEEFQKQFDSDSVQKKYHYNQIQKGFQVPLDLVKRQAIDTRMSWFELLAPLLNRFNKKYQSFETMDHYDEIEKQERKEKEKQQKTLWKSKIDELKETEDEFKQVKQIRKQLHSDAKRNTWSNLKTPTNTQNTNQDKHDK